ncbi:leucine zipper putative tumor suppressor 2 homolog isoform X2 [Artemia franciscana]|uniref:leucine zipper putative tumor suppressor 2 homolog isoform X2 n=1 Tax=Artemia franciscana TaxID=6661 RepID=UPI0032DB06BE
MKICRNCYKKANIFIVCPNGNFLCGERRGHHRSGSVQFPPDATQAGKAVWERNIGDYNTVGLPSETNLVAGRRLGGSLCNVQDSNRQGILMGTNSELQLDKIAQPQVRKCDFRPPVPKKPEKVSQTPVQKENDPVNRSQLSKQHTMSQTSLHSQSSRGSNTPKLPGRSGSSSTLSKYTELIGTATSCWGLSRKSSFGSQSTIRNSPTSPNRSHEDIYGTPRKCEVSKDDGNVTVADLGSTPTPQELIRGSSDSLNDIIGGDSFGSMDNLDTPLDLSFDPEGTPSPSDSGVGEWEAILREKDSEISFLRETMEQNEAVIFKVYEEKEKAWEREMKRLRGHYDSRLKGARQKILDLESSQSMKSDQWNNERQRLQMDVNEQIKSRQNAERQIEELRRDVTTLQQRLDEASWLLCNRAGEIGLLKSQLKELQGDQTNRGQEMVRLRAQIRDMQLHSDDYVKHNSLPRKDAGSRLSFQEKPRIITDHNYNESDVEKELMRLKKEMDLQKQDFEREKQIWQEEKDTVLRYQKQLQQSYVKVFQRNKVLEEELARIGLNGFDSVVSANNALS